MEANYQDSASYRWLNKKVLDSRLLDDMHSLDKWTAITNGPGGLVDARVPYQAPQANQSSTEILLTRENSRDESRTPPVEECETPFALPYSNGPLHEIFS